MRHFLAWFDENGFSLMGMVAAWHANSATSGLVWDLTIAAAALTLWVLIEVVRSRNWWGLAGDSGDLLHRGQLRPAALSRDPARAAQPSRNARLK